jgi:putative tricarboxylic transport membrane protein
MVSRRSLETATAILTGAFGAAVVVSSLDNGIGWSAAGVDAGTFPFIVGLIIFGGSVFNIIRGWPGNGYAVLTPSELKRLAILFVPATAYVGLIPLIGMYLASAIYVFGALSWHKRGSPNRIASPDAMPPCAHSLFDHGRPSRKIRKSIRVNFP